VYDNSFCDGYIVNHPNSIFFCYFYVISHSEPLALIPLMSLYIFSYFHMVWL